jgi:hypothetical protein
MYKLALYVVLCGSLGLAACGNSGPVTEQHIAMATQKCEVNDGLRQVELAGRTRETESCGYRCSRATGKYEYTETFSCKNGARFDLTWTE